MSIIQLPSGKYYKLLNELEVHRGMVYKTGLNEDVLPFNPNGECHPGGLYFFHESQLRHFVRYISFHPMYIREVTIPENTPVYAEKHKYKASSIILGKRELFHDFLLRRPQLCIDAVQINSLSIRYIPNEFKTLDVCKMALVQDNGILRRGNGAFDDDFNTYHRLRHVQLLSWHFIPEKFQTEEMKQLLFGGVDIPQKGKDAWTAPLY